MLPSKGYPPKRRPSRLYVNNAALHTKYWMCPLWWNNEVRPRCCVISPVPLFALWWGFIKKSGFMTKVFFPGLKLQNKGATPFGAYFILYVVSGGESTLNLFIFGLGLPFDWKISFVMRGILIYNYSMMGRQATVRRRSIAFRVFRGSFREFLFW